MVMVTEVIHLGTAEIRVYTLPPREAVIAAYHQARGNYNTWTYPNLNTPLYEGERTIAAGEWCALKEKTE